MIKRNENYEAGTIGDDRQIDRLVDGELPEAERRALLSRLGAEPDGWRQCALAFLEAQTWREALDPREPLALLAQTTANPRRVSVLPRVRRLFSLAASLLAAFAVGWLAHARGTSGDSKGGPGATTVVTRPAGPAPVVVSRPAPAAAPAPASASLPVALESTTGRPLAVLGPIPAAFSDRALKAWERKGYQVERKQRLVSMELRGGRHVSVPVDEVRFTFIGDRTY
jgi:hypothetical protein